MATISITMMHHSELTTFSRHAPLNCVVPRYLSQRETGGAARNAGAIPTNTYLTCSWAFSQSGTYESESYANHPFGEEEESGYDASLHAFGPIVPSLTH